MMNRIKNHAWVILLIVGAIMIGIGIIREEHLMVLEKAIMICLECIGIG